MPSIANQLSAEIAARLHPDRRKHEATYCAVRESPLDHYLGQCIGFADNRVIASGSTNRPAVFKRLREFIEAFIFHVLCEAAVPQVRLGVPFAVLRAWQAPKSCSG